MMKIPISKRLLLSAAMIPNGARVADIGCDHGYLGIYLLANGIAKRVIASDLRPMPLAAAKRNAARFGVSDRMDFLLSDGLSSYDPESVDTIVCAGMGGDLIRFILEAAPWIRNNRITLVLQPQSAAHELRKWLYDEGFAILQEASVTEGHVYFAMRVQYTGEKTEYTPGSLFVTEQMLQTDCKDYLDRMLISLDKSLSGLRKAAEPGEKLAFYQQAYTEVQEMIRAYDNRQRNS